MGGRADCGRAIRLAAACTECQRRKQKACLMSTGRTMQATEIWNSSDHLLSAAANGPVTTARQDGSPICVDSLQRMCPGLPGELSVSRGLYTTYALSLSPPNVGLGHWEAIKRISRNLDRIALQASIRPSVLAHKTSECWDIFQTVRTYK